MLYLQNNPEPLNYGIVAYPKNVNLLVTCHCTKARVVLYAGVNNKLKKMACSKTRNTPQQPNTGTPEHPGTPQNTPEHRNTP